MPMREIKKKFTLSEIAIMSWRSREMNASIHKGRKKSEPSQAREPDTEVRDLPELDQGLQHKPRDRPSVRVIEHDNSYELPKEYNNGVAIPKSFFNDEGEIDLSKVTGPQAVRYLNAIGIRMPTFFR